MKNVTLIALLFAFIACDGPDSKESSSTVHDVDSLFEAYHEFKARINPIEATKGGDNRYNDVVANYISDAYQEDLIENYTSFLGQIERTDQSLLEETDITSLKVMEWDVRIKLEGLSNKMVTVASPMFDLPSFELMPITQITSLQLYFSQLATGRSVQPFNEVSDYENWLSRVDDYLVWIDTCMAKMREGMEKEVVLPKVLTERVISQLDPFIEVPLEDHLFYQPIALIPTSVSAEDRNRITANYKEMISEKLIPKYKELRSFLQNTYLPAGRESSGIGDLPDGEETYNYLIKLHTTTDMTADEIFKLGQREVARIEGEMEKVKQEIGYEGDLKSFLDHIRNRPDQMPYNQPEQVIGHFNEIHERMQANIGKLFKAQPKAGFEVRRTEAFREQSASAEYVPGSKDATRPGVFYVPIPDVEGYNKFQDEALFLHEAIPGHHYQLSLQQENDKLPTFLHAEGMGVFVEGWALYSESLGKELGLYEDPYQYFGMLSMEMHRAIRLVVDAGMHAKGWTREQAIRYSLEHEAESEADITSEIERYMATPGQALSYKIGQLKIRELRNWSSQELGEQFDIKDFHDQVLNSGSLPVLLLEEKIRNWVQDILEAS